MDDRMSLNSQAQMNSVGSQVTGQMSSQGQVTMNSQMGNQMGNQISMGNQLPNQHRFLKAPVELQPPRAFLKARVEELEAKLAQAKSTLVNFPPRIGLAFERLLGEQIECMREKI